MGIVGHPCRISDVAAAWWRVALFVGGVVELSAC